MRLTDFTIGKLLSRIYYKQALLLLALIEDVEDLTLLQSNQDLRVHAEYSAQHFAPSLSISTTIVNLNIISELELLF